MIKPNNSITTTTLLSPSQSETQTHNTNGATTAPSPSNPSPGAQVPLDAMATDPRSAGRSKGRAAKAAHSSPLTNVPRNSNESKALRNAKREEKGSRQAIKKSLVASSLLRSQQEAKGEIDALREKIADLTEPIAPQPQLVSGQLVSFDLPTNGRSFHATGNSNRTCNFEHHSQYSLSVPSNQWVLAPGIANLATVLAFLPWFLVGQSRLTAFIFLGALVLKFLCPRRYFPFLQNAVASRIILPHRFFNKTDAFMQFTAPTALVKSMTTYWSAREPVQKEFTLSVVAINNILRNFADQVEPQIISQIAVYCYRQRKTSHLIEQTMASSGYVDPIYQNDALPDAPHSFFHEYAGCVLALVGIEPNPGPQPDIPCYATRRLNYDKLLKNDRSPLLEIRSGCAFQGLPPFFSDDMRGTGQSLGPLCPDLTPGIFSNNEHNLYQAIRNRFVCPLPSYDDKVVARFIIWVKQSASVVFSKARNTVCVPFQTVIQESNASASVKARLSMTADELVARGYSTSSLFDKRDLKRALQRSAFMKVEQDFYTNLEGVKPKSPRVISASSPEYTLILGSFINPLAKRFKSFFHPRSPVCWASGMNNRQISDWARRCPTDWHLSEDDVSLFDSSIRPWFTSLENWIFSYCGAPPSVTQLMCPKKIKHTTRYGWSFTGPDQRCSGQPHTSLGNFLANFLMHLFIYCNEHSVAIGQALREVRFIISGDDSVLCTKRYTDWKSGMLSFGFKATTIQRPTMDTVGFCSKFFTPVQGGLACVGNPTKMLMKFGTFTNNLSRDFSSLLNGAALSIVNELSVNPAYAAYVAQYITKPDALPLYQPYSISCETPLRPNAKTIFFLERRFGFYLATLEHSCWLTAACEASCDGPSTYFSFSDPDITSRPNKVSHDLTNSSDTVPHDPINCWSSMTA